MASLGSVQIHEMNKRAALLFPRFGYLQRIIIVYRFLIIIALHESDAFAATYIDCRIYDKEDIPIPTFLLVYLIALHYVNVKAKKLRSRLIPSSPLFSGWNCMPYTEPRPTMAVTG